MKRSEALAPLAALAAWLAANLSSAAALAQAGPPSSLQVQSEPSGGMDLGFDLNVPSNIYYIWLFATAVGAVALSALHYRAWLADKIRQGVHPDRWSFTVRVFWLGMALTVAFLLLERADLGVHLALAAIFVLVLIFALFTSRALLVLPLVAAGCLILAAGYRYSGWF